MYSLIPFEKYTNSMDHFYDNIPRFFMTAGDNQPSAFRTDIQDLGDRYLLEADLPGFRKEEISLDLKGDLLTVPGRRASQVCQGRGCVSLLRLCGRTAGEDGAQGCRRCPVFPDSGCFRA